MALCFLVLDVLLFECLHSRQQEAPGQGLYLFHLDILHHSEYPLRYWCEC